MKQVSSWYQFLSVVRNILNAPCKIGLDVEFPIQSLSLDNFSTIKTHVYYHRAKEN